MITIASHPANGQTALRLAEDLRQRGYETAETVQPGREHILVVLLAADSAADRQLMRTVEAALDAGQHVIPVLLQPVILPRLIDHLDPVDFSSGYDLNAMEQKLKAALLPDARRPLRVRTTRVQAANRRAGIVLVALVLLIFVGAMYFIRAGVIGLPEEEYRQIDTQAAATRDALIAPTMAYLSTTLPRSTEQALEFDTTLRAVPTLLRPFVALTATAMHEQLQTFEPGPTPTPEVE